LRNAVVSGCGARALAAEPRTSLLATATRVAAARARGAKLIVVDPRRIGFVVEADCWLPVRPGPMPRWRWR
jgi:anaerobic selenocysteine-containing dehydrogenase